MARGPHVILLHQHSEPEASERIAMLEKVITGFLLALRRRGDRACGPAPAAGLSLVCRQERFPGISSRGSRPTRLRRREATFIRPGTPWSRSTRRSTDEQRDARGKLAARRDELQSIRPAVGHSACAGEDPDRAGRRAGCARWAVPRREPRSPGSRAKSRVKRCCWIWIGGRSIWARRPMR